MDYSVVIADQKLYAEWLVSTWGAESLADRAAEAIRLSGLGR